MKGEPKETLKEKLPRLTTIVKPIIGDTVSQREYDFKMDSFKKMLLFRYKECKSCFTKLSSRFQPWVNGFIEFKTELNVTCKEGRKLKDFENCAPVTKRKRTATLRKSYSIAELTSASATSYRTHGERRSANLRARCLFIYPIQISRGQWGQSDVIAFDHRSVVRGRLGHVWLVTSPI